jgi:hypothetical protein
MYSYSQLLRHNDLKAGIVGCVDAAITRQWRVKHVSMAMSKHATTEELLEVVFCAAHAEATY